MFYYDIRIVMIYLIHLAATLQSNTYLLHIA